MVRSSRLELRAFVEKQAQEGISPSKLLREIEQRTDDPPSRSTVFAWAQAARDRLERDRSGRWLLAGDTSGRPDLVLRVEAALLRVMWADADARVPVETVGIARSLAVLDEARRGSEPPPITHADATWIGRLGRILSEPKNDDEALDLLFIAREYVIAEGRDDDDELALLDRTVAMHAFPTPKE